ncbi:hypothetical protein EWB00_004358 [Schistosoma japonicum]|uniref:Uncharacterized protein n=1 Tax=Schistosoma japonicum TaxID=6182 RepID=A0A4Z2D5Z4_SCHJA|nr:hypothetical protein KSF78_0000912 [Schistosoma japonicum]TNN11903.1 hypothetical protein EWB00_004358 [Schistosoma japonicum]
MNTIYLVITRCILSMITQQSTFRRRRSSSLSSINTNYHSDDDDFWSASSSRKTSKESEYKKKISLSTVQSANELHIPFPNDMLSENEQSHETLYNYNESHTVRESRTNSFQFDNFMYRRQSVSLPGFQEGLHSGKLVSRLSLVGDELEESLKKFKNSNEISTKRRWTIFDSSTSQPE